MPTLRRASQWVLSVFMCAPVTFSPPPNAKVSDRRRKRKPERAPQVPIAADPRAETWGGGARHRAGERFLALLQRGPTLILHCPFSGGSPGLWVRLVVAIPVVRASRRVEIVAPLHAQGVPVSKKDIISLRVRRRSFLY